MIYYRTIFNRLFIARKICLSSWKSVSESKVNGQDVCSLGGLVQDLSMVEGLGSVRLTQHIIDTRARSEP
jgi:hypothetical protein